MSGGVLARVLLACAVAGAGSAQAAADASAAPAANYFAGLALVDQDGKPVDLYRDYIDGHTIVLATFFASCAGVCPVTMSRLQAVQKRLGERIGNDVRIVAISVDPEHDTPALLHDYAQRLHAKPGWSFLTGTRAQVDAALKRIGQYAANPDDHSTLLVVGNARTGLWKKAIALGAAESVVDVVVSVADDPGA